MAFSILFLPAVAGCTIVAGVIVLRITLSAIYNLYFHPLSKFNGPRLWVAFPFVRHLYSIRGNFDTKLQQYHETYGDVVRFSANELSFITAQAWKDIYGHGYPQLRKHHAEDSCPTPDIIVSNDVDHARYRKKMARSFSDKAIRDQRSIVETHVDTLILRLKEIAFSGERVDMVKWFNFTTFDLIGDLTFGESFNCLHEKAYHPWVSETFGYIRSAPLLRLLKLHPLVWQIFCFFRSKKMSRARYSHRKVAKVKSVKRANNSELHGRGDFMDALLVGRGEKDGLSDEELASNANVLFVAGSETMATLLSGVTFWLLAHPDKLEKATSEVRREFENEQDINSASLATRLPYLLASLNEALRIYPPTPTILARHTPPNVVTRISGYEVPGNCIVGVHHLGAYRSGRNFYEPKMFAPERWLPEAKETPSSPFYNDNREVWEPFGVGPRNCIARNLAYNQMCVILTRVLWNFDLQLFLSSRDWWDQKTYSMWDKKPLICSIKTRRDSLMI